MSEKDIDLMKKLTRVEWLLHRYHLRNHMHFGPMGDPRRGQGRVLAILKMQPEISQKDLSYLLDMRPQSLGELLSKLERSGYITRTPSETDRRVMNIKLTKEGMEATESTEQESNLDTLFDCLSEEEQEKFGGYLDRIIEALEASFESDQPAFGFDPRFHDGNPFEGHFGGHPNCARGRGHMVEGHCGMDDHPSDPRLHMRRLHHGHMPFGPHEGDRHFGPRPDMGRGEGDRPAPSQDKPDEE